MATKNVKKKPAKSAGPCTCMNLIDNKLRDFNTRLHRQLSICFATGTCDTLPVILTEKIDAKKRTAKKTVVATYCPFCGRKL